jgi:large subunit ribosomal protein L5
VALVDPETKKPTRVGHRVEQVTKARKSIAPFKLREGMPIGAHVTLRGDRMLEFLDRLLSLALPRLKQKYRSEVIAALQEQYKYGNPMQIPGLVKVVVNMGVGEAARDAKLIDGAVRDLTTITGQKPLVRRATKSIAQFKLREGMPIGAKVTLRGDRMWEFLDRLLSISLPRIRDFRGLDGRKLDGHGNYTFGLTEQSVFHEIDQDKIDRPRGMDITVVTTASTDDEGRALLKLLGFPFKEN